MKMRSDCILNSLTPDQLNQLFDWIASGVSFREASERCVAPPPRGFGVPVHITTLRRFYKAERRRRHAEELAETRFNELATENPEELLNNIKVELAHACYDLADISDPAAINSLSRITHRFELVKLEQQRLTLERDFLTEKKRQFNFNAAREAAKYAHKIKNVIQTKGPDAEDKLWKISEIVFGPPPTPSPDEKADSLQSSHQNSTK